MTTAFAPVADRIVRGVRTLAVARAATGEELAGKFRLEKGSFQLVFGNSDLFSDGLAGLIGPPSPHIRLAMEREHCSESDSEAHSPPASHRCNRPLPCLASTSDLPPS